MLRKQKIKKICFILFTLILICFLFKYTRKIIAIVISRYYFEVNLSLGKVLLNAIIICIGSLLSILVCWIVGKYRDKKIMNVEGSFSNRHPRLNMIVGLALVVIIGTICFVVAHYTFLYLGRKINALVDWVTNMASKMDAVVIVAFITGTVSIVGVIISSIVAKIIDYRKSRQDYLARKREIPYGEFVEMIYKIRQNVKNSGSYTEESCWKISLDFQDKSHFGGHLKLCRNG